jgi:hypothetical protein
MSAGSWKQKAEVAGEGRVDSAGVGVSAAHHETSGRLHTPEPVRVQALPQTRSCISFGPDI